MIIAVTERQIGTRKLPTVAGRDLHFRLGGRDENFATWSRRQIRQAKLQPDADYHREVFHISHRTGAKLKTEVIFSLPAARRIAAAAGTERGCDLRQALVQIENPPAPPPPGFAAVAARVVALEEENAELKARAKLYDVGANTSGWLDMRAAAKALGFGSTTFFDRLRAAGILLKINNTPAQEHINCGRFKVIHSHYRDQKTGERVPYAKTVISPKGMQYVAARLEAATAARKGA